MFDYGFRPFFLLAGFHAFAVVPVWLYFYAHHGAPFGLLPTMYWHSHEMLYGFVVAAISGFMLTAVPSWTGTRGFGGVPLIVLVTLWLAGRVSMASAGSMPFWLVAIAELAMLPTLAALLVPPLFRSGNRNMPLLAVLGTLWLADVAFVVSLGSGNVALAARATNFGINVVLILVTVIGGRIVPAFTANTLRRRGDMVGLISHAWLEKLVIGTMIAIAFADAFAPAGIVSGILAGIAALGHAYRLSGWRGFRTRGESILWVLHVAYAWLPIGLGLKALWLLGGVSFATKWQHALAMGVFGTMILAVMTRASLGHTGRALAVSRAITVAYVLLTLAVLARVFGGALWPERYLLAMSVAGLGWMASFLVYLVVYTPILVGPRADGKPG